MELGVNADIVSDGAEPDERRLDRSITDRISVDVAVPSILGERIPLAGTECPGAFDGRFGNFVFRNVVDPFARPPGHRPT